MEDDLNDFACMGGCEAALTHHLDAAVGDPVHHLVAEGEPRVRVQPLHHERKAPVILLLYSKGEEGGGREK
jgi:hypothetical protein